MKTATAKKPEQELQKVKVDMIPARLVWDHVDRLDGLNGALNWRCWWQQITTVCRYRRC